MTTTDALSKLHGDVIHDRRHLWVVFRASNIYRLILATLLLVVFMADSQNQLFGKQDPRLFLATAGTYMALAVIAIVGSYWRRPRLMVQAHLQILIDLLALTLMISASGGLSSSLNSLLIAAVAAGSILLPLASSLASAALGFFLLTGAWLLDCWETALRLERLGRGPGGWPGLWDQLHSSADDLVRLGVLGAVLFIAALLTHALAERARRGEALARQRSQELLQIAELNQGIIRHLQNGIVVIDTDNRVQLLNDTARTLLGCVQARPGMAVSELSLPLAQQLQAWQTSGGFESSAFRPADHRPELIPRFTRLSGRQATNIMVMLEDSEQTAQQLQQIKLAALGRLTAGIAHEIRNPLAAISHAAQLLLEATQSAGHTQQRLSQIVYDNVKRANRIISDVLDLARRDRVKPEWLVLDPWLEAFRHDFPRGLDGPAPEWGQQVEPADLTISFDSNQLQQILWNLCTNACLHGTRSGEIPHIELHAGLEGNSGRPFLDVRDAGPGVSVENISHLFEPFFTTRTTGTGLGLYLARELCEANRAQLQYRPPPEGGGCFRITFTVANPVMEAN